MTHPTNTDLADALRDIANTLPLGSALVLRLAADRLMADTEVLGEHDPDVDPWLGDDTDGWIEWDASAPNASMGPRRPNHTEVEVRFKDGHASAGIETIGWWLDGIGVNNWSHTDPKYTISAYRVVR